MRPALVNLRFPVRPWLGVLLLLLMAGVAAGASRAQESFGRTPPPSSARRGVEPGETEWDEVLRSEEALIDEEGFQTLPVQYPLENDLFEGRDPDGGPLDYDPQAPPDWREQTVIPGTPYVQPEFVPFVQWSNTRYTIDVVPRTEDGLGFTNFEFRGTVKFPRAPYVWISPRFAWHFLNGPSTTPNDVPGEIYDGSIDTTFAIANADRSWIGQFVIAPGVFTDFNYTKDAFRLAGRAVAIHQWRPQTQIVFGISYLGRKDIPWVPAVGMIHVPNERWRYEIMLPRPRIAYRYHSDGDRERWAYVAGEMGGGSWAVERASGLGDLMTYRDFQFLAGIEHKEPGRLNWQCEAGWVFLRRLEFESTIGNRDLSSTGILRVMFTY